MYRIPPVPEAFPNERLSLGFAPRIGLLALLFVLELIAISIWLDTSTIAAQGGLTGFVSQWGSRVLQATVAFASLLVTFGYLQAKSTIQRLSDQLTRTPMTLGWFAGHTVAMVIFGFLSYLLFQNYSGVSSDWIAAAWLTAGVCGIVLAGLAFVPSGAWFRLFRETGTVFIAAAVAGIGVSLFAQLGSLYWKSSAAATFAVVNAGLRLFSSDVVSDPAAATIGTPRFQVTIAPGCSGLEGVGLILAFTIAWLWFFRRECRFPQALAVIPVSALAVWLLNSLRIASLILIGNAGAAGIALGGFHSQAGWIAFNGVALGFSLAFRRLQWLMAGERAPETDEPTENPAAAYLAPFLAILAAGMAARAVSSGFEWLYPLRFLAAVATLWAFRRKYSGQNWSVGFLAPLAGILIFVMWLGVDWAAGIHPESALGAGLASLSVPGRAAWIAFRVLAAVVTVPIAEELAFRGFLIRRLMSADFEKIAPVAFSYVAVVVSSVAFGILHGERWIAGTLAGLIYAFVYLRRGRIGDAVVAHATTNALIAVWVLMGSRWYLW